MHRFRVAMLGVALALFLGACGYVTPGPVAPTSPSADVSITSGSLAFNTSTLSVPAGRAFSLLYSNGSPMPHNVAIYSDQSWTTALFVGDVIGEGSVVYEVSALAAGQYFFRCDIHPEMHGVVDAI